MGVPLSAVAAMMRSSPPAEAPRFFVYRDGPRRPVPDRPLRGYISIPFGATSVGVAMWSWPFYEIFPGSGGLRPEPTRFIEPPSNRITLVGAIVPFAFPMVEPGRRQVVRAWGIAPGGALGPPRLCREDVVDYLFFGPGPQFV